MSWPELSFPWFLPFSTSLIGLSIYYKVDIRLTKKLCSCIYFLASYHIIKILISSSFVAVQFALF
eukprot:01672.XXX_723_917_1 [CDS] Oithona nana genome sequencing.